MSDSAWKPTGQRFSHVYVDRGQPDQDSQRARRRIASLIYSMKDLDGLGSALPSELGIDPIWGTSGVNWPKTCASIGLRDFLDLPTIACRHLEKKKLTGIYDRSAKERLLKEVARIFSEENLCYEIDDHGGTHYRVDAEFSANRNAAIAALASPRYANARQQFEAGMAELSQNTDGKQCIRGVFNAVECVFKLMHTRAPKLTSGAALSSLQSVLQRLYTADSTATRAANKSLSSFADWVDGCHEYRHEQGVEEPSQPPMALSIQMISAGASFLRWLIDIDRQTDSPVQ